MEKKVTPEWLSLPWIKPNEIFRILAGTREKSKTDYYYLKAKGTRSWEEAELQKLEEIRKQLINDLKNK